MASSSFDITARYYNALNTVVHSGYANLLPDVNRVLDVLIIISITLTALLVWTSDEGYILKPVLQSILTIGFFVYLVENWEYLTQTLMSGFFYLGRKAGGAGMDGDIANYPARVMGQGYDLSMSLFTETAKHVGFKAIFDFFPVIFIYLICLVVVVFCFAWFAVEVFLTIVEYKFIAIVGFILVPLNVWKGTETFGGGILRYIVAAGVKVMTITMIVALTSKIVPQIIEQSQDSFSPLTAYSVMFSALVTLVLALKIPNLAQAAVSGQSVMSAGSAVSSMVGAATGAAAGVGAGLKAAQAMKAVQAAKSYDSATNPPDNRA